MFIPQFAKVFEKTSYLRYWLTYSLSSIGFELILFTLIMVIFDSMKTGLSMGIFTAIYMFCLIEVEELLDGKVDAIVMGMEAEPFLKNWLIAEPMRNLESSENPIDYATLLDLGS
jgi:hypothetical protein